MAHHTEAAEKKKGCEFDIPYEIMQKIIRAQVKKMRTSASLNRISRKAFRLLHREVEAVAKHLFEVAQGLQEKMHPDRKTLHVEVLQVATQCVQTWGRH
jgi:histone H3/H4